jgi:hypothetical protein
MKLQIVSLLSGAVLAAFSQPVLAMSDVDLDSYARKQGFSKQIVSRGNHYSSAFPWITTASGLSYQFAFNSTARYNLNNVDQYDWNKLPGMGDCGSIALSRNGAMFGWRWNVLTQRLEISAYANRFGQHQYWDNNQSSVQLIELEMADVQDFAPLRFDIQIQDDRYLFRVSGRLPNGRVIDAQSTLARGCESRPNRFKNGSNFYFGGTSVAPANTSGYVKWIRR